ncbi:MAG: (d)CMP kinase [Saprospiraceae bacterium]|nr:(d)CMP kinase [Saprospiraceae bacterium]MBK8449988.1 (d)CMP kinase [Saprospiraceae bacterium]MBK9721699.1 (d)CMP kinase [Saprospiraceae bacterium]
MYMIIAIDGHSACGKSTLAKDLAKKLQVTYIDSGAMYRAATLYLIKNKLSLNQLSLPQNLDQIKIDFIPGENPKILLNNTDVTDEIRSPKVSELVSEVSTIPELRKKMVQLQKSMALEKSVIMDGRDIGSVVFPFAEIKFFVTADLETRANRRFEELKKKDANISIEDIKANLMKRDQIDSNRNDSPLIQTSDAILIDNSRLTRIEQCNLALEIILRKGIFENNSGSNN